MNATGFDFVFCNKWPYIRFQIADNTTLWPEGTWGLRIGLRWGRHTRPIPRLRWYTAKTFMEKRLYHPWTSGNHWFVLKIPFAILPWIALVTPWKKAYAGGKIYRMHESYFRWAGKDAFSGKRRICFSATFRGLET